ncbi:deaminated glutathione amidase, chloroplastic/cytosolic-like isoform X1 [Humulus lupulus]|uniref:deaminated glutathione amidase, chloroplastic/cytosolic-like isoform X1 n=1 Tax=Humulus lupulus TaxID=3486 RepID=UPI002B412C4E|nr:deaminated glutathione amidase, chloroplastic/cytosolic-like isoform X1 [Humulus lupulus]XP_062081683.1 deaminated glutathione amidase, chloroplastic/cytosolic-like isoform X1 [Humulus lupulus]
MHAAWMLTSPVKEAASARAKLICFPENCAFVGAKEGESLKIAEPLDGPIMKRYCSLASVLMLSIGCRESCIWLSLGGFQEKGPDEQHLCNTHVVIDDNGNIKSTYKKIHLFLFSLLFLDRIYNKENLEKITQQLEA